MWYVAAVMMAQPKKRGRRRYLCETCNVLLSAADAGAAYRKAVEWGTRYEADSIYRRPNSTPHLTRPRSSFDNEILKKDRGR